MPSAGPAVGGWAASPEMHPLTRASHADVRQERQENDAVSGVGASAWVLAAGLLAAWGAAGLRGRSALARCSQRQQQQTLSLPLALPAVGPWLVFVLTVGRPRLLRRRFSR